MRTKYSIGIIIFNHVLTSEAVGPAEVFGIASKKKWFQGSSITLISAEKKTTVRTEEGLALVADMTIFQDRLFDVLIVPGSNNEKPLLANDELKRFIKKHSADDAIIGSVCSGAFLLGNAGVLNGRKATTYQGGASKLQAMFPKMKAIENAPLVIDDRLYTGKEGLMSYQLALTLLGRLSTEEHAREVYETLAMGQLGSWAEIKKNIQMD